MVSAPTGPVLDSYFLPGEKPRDPGRSPFHIPRPPPHFGRFIILVFLAVFFITVSTMVYMTVYRRTRLPGLTAQNRLVLVKVLYQLPFLPKTPEQILLSAVEQNVRMTKYTPDFSFSGALHSSGISGGSLDFHIRGPIDYSDVNNVSFDMSASFSANFAGTTYQGSTLMRKNGDAIYAKIDSLSDSVIDIGTSFGGMFGASTATPEQEEARKKEIRENITKLLAYWILYDTSGVTSEARKQLNEITSDESIPETVQKQASDFLLQDHILPEVKRLADETIDTTPTYHLRLEPSKKLLITILEKAYETYETRQRSLPTSINVLPMTTGPATTEKEKENIKRGISLFVESLEDVRTDIYVGKSDTLLRKASWQLSVNFSKLVSEYGKYADEFSSGSSTLNILPFAPSVNELASAKLSLASNFSLYNLGQSFTVDTPKNATSPAAFLEMMTDAMKTKAEKAYEEQKTLWEEDFKRLSTLLLRYYGSHNSTYPIALGQVTNAYIVPDEALKDSSSGASLRQRASSYTYQRSDDGKKYLLYVDDPFPRRGYSSSDSTLYGVTSESRYPQYLDKYDIDRLLAPPEPTVTPWATPTRRPIPTVAAINNFGFYVANSSGRYPINTSIPYRVDAQGIYATAIDSIKLEVYTTASGTGGRQKILTTPSIYSTGGSGDTIQTTKYFRGQLDRLPAGVYDVVAIGYSPGAAEVTRNQWRITVTSATPTPLVVY